MIQTCSAGLLALIPLLVQGIEARSTPTPTLQFVGPVASCQEGAPEVGAVQGAATDIPVVTTATDEEVAVMLRSYESARKSGVAAEVIESLQRMELHDNEELIAPASQALQYRATRTDKKAVAEEAKTLGTTKRSEVAAMVLDLESEVQAAGASVLASIPGKKSTGALMKALKRKDVKDDRPLTMASIIVALGNLGHEAAAKEVEDELKRSRHMLIARASIRYFGQIKTKDMGVVRILISMLDSPKPANVDGASNPPASYWEARWTTWLATRRDVVWALKEITGQTWSPSDGDHESDAARALKYVKENAKRLGIR